MYTASPATICRKSIVAFLFDHYRNALKEWKGEYWSVSSSGIDILLSMVDKVAWARPLKGAIVGVWVLESEWFSVYQICYWEPTNGYKADTIIDIADELLALQLKLMLS
jgi:hypothetical protein